VLATSYDAIKLKKRGLNVRSMTWRALSISPYGVVLPPGEKPCGKVSCALHDPAAAAPMASAPTHALLDQPGTLHVTSAALLWLPDDEDGAGAEDAPGVRVPYQDIDASSITESRLGWNDHVVSVPLKARPGGAWGAVPPPVRFVHLTESAARALQAELRAAAAAAAVSDTVFV